MKSVIARPDPSGVTDFLFFRGTGAKPLYDEIFLESAIKEPPIFVKTYDFTKWLLEHTIKFPKIQRFVIAKRIEEATLNFYDLLLLAIKEDMEMIKRDYGIQGTKPSRTGLKVFLFFCQCQRDVIL